MDIPRYRQYWWRQLSQNDQYGNLLYKREQPRIWSLRRPGGSWLLQLLVDFPSSNYLWDKLSWCSSLLTRPGYGLKQNLQFNKLKKEKEKEKGISITCKTQQIFKHICWYYLSPKSKINSSQTNFSLRNHYLKWTGQVLRRKYCSDTIPWLHGRSLTNICYSLSISGWVFCPTRKKCWDS